jgi:hypothetical protein
MIAHNTQFWTEKLFYLDTVDCLDSFPQPVVVLRIAFSNAHNVLMLG